jgi:hypothetical protein
MITANSKPYYFSTGHCPLFCNFTQHRYERKCKHKFLFRFLLNQSNTSHHLLLLFDVLYYLRVSKISVLKLPMCLFPFQFSQYQTRREYLFHDVSRFAFRVSRSAFGNYYWLVISQWPPLAGPICLIIPFSFNLLMFSSVFLCDMPSSFESSRADM